MPNREFPRAFLAHFREHNWAVFWAICISAMGTLLVWPTIYLFVYVVGLIGLSIFVSPDTGYPPNFPQWFAGIAFAGLPLSLGLQAVMRRGLYSFLQQHQYLRWLVELFLAPYLLTLSVFSHFRAFCLLNRQELREALQLLRRIEDERRIEVRRLEVEIPQPRRRQRILDGLSLVHLIQLLRSGDRLYVAFHDPSVRRLIQPPAAIPSPDRPLPPRFAKSKRR